MEKVELFVGDKYGKQKRVIFSGELVCSKRSLDNPPSDSRGCYQNLYKVTSGFRVYTENWSQWQGEEDENYMDISEVLSEQELIDQFGALATKAGIYETEELD